ncbi:MAG TPA: hypothetical protein VGY56_14145 [Verrucomicrobiae bacterium]|nr:hypothetical protein [Verrucomicrobiae bacterium]
MNPPRHIFELFTRIIADVPARAIIRELDLECEMLEDDLRRHHRPLTRDSFSILRFGQFVRAAKIGREICSVTALPPDHLEFYKTTVVRLIQARELPLSATDQFDHTFAVPA